MSAIPDPTEGWQELRDAIRIQELEDEVERLSLEVAKLRHVLSGYDTRKSHESMTDFYDRLHVEGDFYGVYPNAPQ